MLRALAVGLALAATPAHAGEIAATPALVDAIEADDVAQARAALVSPQAANAPLGYGETPLSRAIETQDAALVDLLLSRGAKAGSLDALGRSPLSLACEHGNGAIVSRLLDAKPGFKPAPDGTSPLAVCARFAPAATVARMLAMGAKPDTPDSRGQTPLMWAASSGQAETVALLLKAGAKVDRVTPAGFTPLFFAIKGGSAPATQAMIAAGADTAHRGPENTSALQLALYQKAWGTAALLITHGGTDLAEIDRNGERPLHVAAHGGDTALVGLMLNKGADPNGLTGPSRIKWVTEANFGVPPPPVPRTPPLQIAARAGQVPVMKLLVARGADPTFVADNGTNVLLTAASGQSPEALDYALSLGGDVNAGDAKGRTALHLVLGGGVKPGLDGLLAVLKAHGARTDIPDKSGSTAAQEAEGGLSTVKAAFEKVFGPIIPSQKQDHP
ncbi:putative ankyrin G [Novosphingobium sp. Rr 2-17]|uniref:ankyrin repeat domain-containing protein n=1 Tax=Novosphingobium sp. Rr 2-17 TaxID=555793 RepID=UPI0002699810|nr:ankyrin repeat domain-containing protein [Novosphingobium sp. Rr 2-17]EIZ81056.1 putative ankyrin G [Novosphingobium sp. Rr 2-17]